LPDIRWSRKLAFLVVLALLVALPACGAAEPEGEEAEQAPETEQAAPEATPEEAEATSEEMEAVEEQEEPDTIELTEAGDTDGSGEGGASGDEAAEAPVTAAGEPAEVRDGVWAVGNAGEVEFAVEDGALELADARPNDGWRMDIDEQAPDEIEVDFERGNVEWEIEIEISGNELEIEIDQDIEPAQAGAYEIGNAGVVEISLDDTGLGLADVSANEGWDFVVDEETPEEIEVEFTTTSGESTIKWDFDAELDDGVLDIEIDQEITGPIPD
jgi:frataxin-like iron-binding protein CyaY